MELRNIELFGQFSSAFANLTKVKSLPAQVKFDLVRLRKDFIETAETIKEAGKDMSQDDVKELMRTTTTYDFKKIDPQLVVEELSADDLYHLQPILKED